MNGVNVRPSLTWVRWLTAYHINVIIILKIIIPPVFYSPPVQGAVVRMVKMRFWCIGLCLALLVAVFSISFGVSGSIEAKEPFSSINVDGNSALDALISSNLWSGSGTETDPYIIQDLAVNGEGSAFSIYIGNTDRHLVIRDCDLFNAVSGVQLYNAQHVTLLNNSCFGNTYYGIYVLSSDHNVILENSCVGNGRDGICLDESDYNTIANNSCDANDRDGIHLYHSNENALTDNACENNSANGIYLYLSHQNGVLRNTCVAEGQHYFSATIGIFLDCSDSNVIVGNGCHHNGDGMKIKDSDSTVISDNDLSYNDGYLGVRRGIYLEYAYASTVTNNTCVGSSTGISSYYSEGSLIVNNTCNDNDQNGITLVSGCGVSSGVLRNNTCSGNSYGIWMSWETGTEVSNNTIEGNTEFGIYTEYRCKSNAIVDNMLSGNGYGLALTNECDGNTVANNTIEGSAHYGIYLSTPIDNLVFGNILMGNNGTSSVHDPLLVQAFDGGANFWNTTSYGNLWGDWMSPDDDGDGIVDLPYLIDGGASQDSYPLSVSIAVTSPANGSWAEDTEVEITGSAVSFLGVHEVTWSNEATMGSGTCAGTSLWSCTVPLAGGENVITFTMTDLAGIVVETNVTVWLDITPPTLVITSPADGSYAGSTVTVTWIGSDAGSGIAYYNVSIGGVDWTTTTESSYTFTGLSNGPHTIFVRAFDAAGNGVESWVNIIVDTIPPTVDISSPTNGQLFGSGTVTVAWSGWDGGSGLSRFEVSVDGGAKVSLSKTTLTYTFAGLTDGTHALRVTAVDMAGRSAYDTVMVNVDTTAPSLTITSPEAGSFIASNDVAVTWTANDAGAGIAHFLVSVDGGAAVQLGADVTSYTLSDLAEGVHVVNVTAVDQLGHEAYAEVELTVDTVAPTATVSPAGEGVDVGAAIEAEFSEVMNKTSVHFTIEGVIGVVSWDGNTATFSHPAPLMYGTAYSVSVTGEDLAGNTYEHEWTFTTITITSFTGTVSGGGAVLAGVNVTITNGLVSATQTTGADGTFTVSFIGNVTGPFTMLLEMDGYLDRTVEGITYAIGGTEDLGQISLEAEERGAGDGTLLYAIVGMAAIIIAAVAVLFLRSRK